MNINLFAGLYKYSKVFKQYTGATLYLFIALLIFAGLLETLGISMLVPILSYEPGQTGQGGTINIVIHNFFSLLNITPSFEILLASMVFLFLIKGAFHFFSLGLMSFLKADLGKALRFKMLDLYIGMKFSYYQNTNIGHLNNMITTEVERAVSTFGYFCRTISCFINAGVYASVCILINYQVTIFAVVSGTCLVVSLRSLNSISRRYSIQVSSKNASLQDFLIQIIQGYKYLKATAGFDRIKKKLYADVDHLGNLDFKLGVISGGMVSIREPFLVIMVAFLMFYQVSILGKSIAGILVVMGLFYKLASVILAIQHEWQGFNALVGGIDVFDRAHEEISANLETAGKKRIDTFDSQILLSDVSFGYGDKLVLNGINMRIPKNKIVGLVGESGAGKSTLVNIFTGLLQVDAGTVSIDGVDAREIDFFSFRKLVGYVTQEDILFHDTIANNISMWQYKGTQEDRKKMDRICRLANCHSFIACAKDGYDAIIGDRGIKISGGQRQRLAIARELYKGPEILLLDEATSALDSQSEAYVHESIESLRGNKTIVIIAHRLSTIKSCDYIYVLHDGRVVEEGTFRNLYEQDTRFRQMCLAQELKGA